MFKKLLDKWLCSHKWECHSKTKNIITYSDKYTGIVSDTKEYYIEILICKECGKIKKIHY